MQKYIYELYSETSDRPVGIFENEELFEKYLEDKSIMFAKQYDYYITSKFGCYIGTYRLLKRKLNSIF